MSKFEIDFFELLFLAEVCIPPVPIARAHFFKKLINVYYEQMTPQERLKMFKFVKKQDKCKTSEPDCKLFLDRYNPLNQYKVFAQGKWINVFKHNNEYNINEQTFVNKEYIKKVEKL